MTMAIPLLLVLVAVIAGLAAWRGRGRMAPRTRRLLWAMAAIALAVALVQAIGGHRP